MRKQLKQFWIVLWQLHDLILRFLPAAVECCLEEARVETEDAVIDIESLLFFITADFDAYESVKHLAEPSLSGLPFTLRVIFTVYLPGGNWSGVDGGAMMVSLDSGLSWL